MTHVHKARKIIFMEWAQMMSADKESQICNSLNMFGYLHTKRTTACIYSICGRFKLRCCGFQGLQVRVEAFVTVHASPGATAGL